MHASRSILSITSCRARLWILAIAFLLIETFASTIAAAADSGVGRITGTVLDPSGLPLAGANVKLDSASGARLIGTTGRDGGFTIALPTWGAYTVRVEAMGFLLCMRTVDLSAAAASLTLRLERVAGAADEVVVTGDVSALTLTSPDPSEKVMVREELLDANPGRPGAPISLPGLPVETASGGIKAPQYFAPGVAGDHGEPIAQYFEIGDFLFPNNLPANAHGNGYADPNPLVSQGIWAVQVDGGAFNVREGNHAVNLAAAYVSRDRLEPFVAITGDYRGLDLAGRGR